jgi:hypothetical protein
LSEARIRVPYVIHHLKLILVIESSSSMLITLGALLLDGYRLPLSYHLVW